MTETNAKPIEPTCSMCPSYPRIQAELSRLTSELKDRERAVESVLDVVSDDYCPTTKKCPEYGKLVRNCRAHWREYLMGGQ